MSIGATPHPPAGAPSRRADWLWVNLIVAAAAMVATLPGRTFGLAEVTEPLLADIHRDRVWFGHVNLWATLLGATFCLAVGRLTDRFGTRVVLAGVMAGLGLVVIGMSAARDAAVIAILVLLTRGFGQSALSVVSLAIVGKSFPGARQGPAMGVYSFLIGIGFAAAVTAEQRTLGGGADWRTVWGGTGLVVLALTVPLAALIREPPAGSPGLPDPDTEIRRTDASLAEALRTPAFWAYALTAAVYNLAITGLTLFNKSLLRERGVEEADFLAILFLVGTGANLVAGWLARRWPMGRLLALAALLLAAALSALPRVAYGSSGQAYGVAAVLAVGGSAVMVVFFAVWRQAFGRTSLGQIQGAAQTITVIASALGPVLFAECEARTGSYALLLDASAVASAVLGLWVWMLRLPRRDADGSVY